MQVKLLKDIVVSIAGPNAVKIVDLLHEKDNVNEFIIAKKLEVTINQARNILYKLSDVGLVSFTRKKDKKSGGWYTYFWTLDVKKALITLREKIIKETKFMQFQAMSKKSKRFYHCKNCDIEVSEENALLYDFTCPECGEVFMLKDNKEALNHLAKELERLEEQLIFVDKEIEVIQKKEDSLKKRRLKAEEKKKKAEREARRIERARLKKLEERESGKKVVKKAKKKKVKVKKKKFAKKRFKRIDVKKRAKKKINRKRPVRKKLLIKKVKGKGPVKRKKL